MKLNIYSLHKKYTNVQILWKHIKQLYKYVNPTKLNKKKISSHDGKTSYQFGYQF